MELESTRIFVKVVQYGSFSRAASSLKMPVSSVSRAVSRLEREIGATLLQRTTRSLKLTASGQAFFDSSVGPIQLLEDARRSLQGTDSIVAGLVKITATEDLGKLAVTPALIALMRKHPALAFEFSYSDELVDLVSGGFDLAVRVGRLASSRFKAIKVGEIAIIAVASPPYLAANPEVRKPKDLAQHTLLGSTGSLGTDQHPRVIGNEMSTLVAIARHGAGIALVPQFVCDRDLKNGSLIRVLPGWSSARFPVFLVSVAKSEMPARVRIVADALTSSLKNVLS
ncbi:MAG: LysR family transcriptional regulator [Oligoflexia bacterium]|nr:LysR family transcriptional regulator [Oligoflexia bacterium]